MGGEVVVEEVIVGTGMSFRDPAPTIDDESRVTWFIGKGFNHTRQFGD